MEIDQQAFKYVLQDFSNVYFGGRLTYEELENMEDTPEKLRAAIYRGFLEETDKNTVIEDHLLALKKEDFSYRLYDLLDIKIKVCFMKVIPEKGDSTVYESSEYTLGEFVEEERLKQTEKDFVIQEIRFKKRKLSRLPV